MAEEQLAEVLAFRKSIAAATGDEEEQVVQTTGRVSEVSFHFPPGPQFLMQVRLLLRRRGSEGVDFLIPSRPSTYLALDDVSKEFRGLDFRVQSGDTLRVEWDNYDSSNAHQVPVTVTILPERGR